MTLLPQTELTVDSESVAEPASSLLSVSSSSSRSRQQQQQQQTGREDGGDSGYVKASSCGVPGTAAGGEDGGVKDDHKAIRVYTCARCDRQFSDETGYEKHCKKCCDD